MTFIKELKSGTDRRGQTITAEVCYDKNSIIPKYYVIVSDENGYAIDVYKTAKTTYSKLFNTLVAE